MRPPRRASSIALAGLVVAGLVGCSSDSQPPSSAFSFPIDFAYACEGEGHTVAPTNDETAATLSATRMCPDLAGGGQGDLFGLVLDRQPAQLLVLQLNPASGTRRLVDADYFTPGITGIPVGSGPLRVLRAPDWSAFYVVSAGDRRVERVVVQGLSADGALGFTTSSMPLPGAPIEAQVLGNDLVIAARDAAELWVFDIGSGEPGALRVVATDDRVAHVEAIAGADAGRIDWLVTFRTRRTVAIIDGASGALKGEAGLGAQCRDGLDNDGDGQADKDDPDCRDMNDDDESELSGAAREEDPGEPLGAFAGAPSCDNDVDDDGDGATDFPEDLACAAADDDAGELRPACDDGIDQDGDGRTDLDDESCYASFQNLEGQLPDDGPFHPTFLDGGVFGRFVYVLDERLGEIAVFDYSTGVLARVDVNAADADPPALGYVRFGDFGDEPEERVAIPAVRPPALHRQGVKNILITETNASSLSSGRLRGELWDRIIDAPAGEPATVSLTPNSNEWKPSFCAPTPTDRCVQPAFDDATWFAFGANLDGRIQLIEAIRRGTPMHRLSQRVVDPALREHDVTAPRLTRRGALVNARGEPQIGLPFIGAAVEEVLEERVATETPERLRRFGIWPPADFEEAPNETWAVTYQGKIPNAGGDLGRFTEAARFDDANGRFCEAGVAPGDILQIVAPIASSDPALVHRVPVIAGELECPTREPKVQLVELTITEVGMTGLLVDLASARRRPLMPVLDLQAIEAQRLSLRACQEALEVIEQELGLPEHLAAAEGFTPAQLPASFTYAARGGEWIFVGSRSGVLHRQRWDRDAGSCVIDESLDARLVGRASEVPDAVAKYDSCPPGGDQLVESTVNDIAPAETRFFNPSFGLDIFPACEPLADGTIAPVPSQQDTAFTFVVTGPHQGSALSVANAVAIARVPLLDFRRQQVQLDTAAKRAAILQLRLGDPEVIVIFE